MEAIIEQGQDTGGMVCRLSTSEIIEQHQPPAIVRPWKRALVVGCSHGQYADPLAVNAVLQFHERYKPSFTAHLGDFCDLSALMSSNVRNGDGDDISPDVDGGIEFLQRLRPNVVLFGNHEDRIDRLCESRSAIVSELSLRLRTQVYSAIHEIGSQVVPYTGHYQRYPLGNYHLTHGSVFNESATRDEAEIHGNIIHAHTHRSALSKGRRHDNPTGICVGTLTRRGAMQYAKTKKSELSWSQGFVFGEYCDDLCQWWLHEQQKDSTEWRLPI